MRPTWTDDEKGEAAGIAHRAAFLTVRPEPEDGFRNSYSYPDPLATAHDEAHRAMDDYPGLPGLPDDFPAALDYAAAWDAIAGWDEAGRPVVGYEAHVPRLSQAAPSAGDNPRQRP